MRVTGRRMSTCGMSCSGPILACGRDGQPPISSTGARASEALAMAVTVLVTPGPAVTMATPSAPVSSAWACAMCTAAPSCAHVDDANAVPRDVIPDRLDVAALQAEDAVDAARLEKARDPGGADSSSGVAVDAGFHAHLLLGRSCCVAQHAMQDLAGRGARHLLLADEGDRARPLVAGDAVLAPVEELALRRRRRPSCRTITACTRSPHFGSGTPITATSFTLRMRAEHGLRPRTDRRSRRRR